MSSRRSLVVGVRILMVLAFFCAANFVSAATYTWDRGAFTPYWNHVNNWSSNSYPGMTDDVHLGGTSLVDYQTVFVPLGASQYDQIGSLTLFTSPGLTNPGTVQTNGYELIVNGETLVRGAGSELTVNELSGTGNDGDSLDTNTLTVDLGGIVNIRGGVLEVDGGASTYPLLRNAGVVAGWGTIDIVTSSSSTSPIIFSNGLVGSPGTLLTGTPIHGVGDTFGLEINVVDTSGNYDSTATVDLDGDANGNVAIAPDTRLYINAKLQDGFSTTMSFRSNTRLDMLHPWALDGSAIVNVDSHIANPLLDGRARITGAALDVRDTAMINIDSGILEIDTASFMVNSGVTIVMNSGDIEVQVADGEWEMAGRLEMNNTNTSSPGLRGSDVVVSGDVRVGGVGSTRIGASSVFTGSSSVNVPTDTGLRVAGVSTRISGGSWTGEGLVDLRSNTTIVDADTTVTMPAGIFDLDGDSPGALIQLDRQFRLEVQAIDKVGPNEIEDDVAINPDGRLDVRLTNASDSYVLARTLDLNAYTGTFASLQLAGSDVGLRGTTNVTGNSIASARVDITGTVNIGSNSSFNVRGGTLANPNRIEAGTIAGLGELRSNFSHALTGYGTINADVRFGVDSELRAADGRLTVNGTIHDVHIIGTANTAAILEVTNPWNTDVATDALVLEGGQVVGSTITNDGQTRGFGYIRTAGFVNNSVLSAAGDGVLVIDTVGNPNLDGTSAIAVVNAVDGDLWVTKPFDPFDDVMNIGAGHYARFDAGWRLQSVHGPGELNLMGDPDSLSAARVRGGPQRLAGTVNVTREAIFYADTTFESGVTVNLAQGNDYLRMINDSLIAAGAEFLGRGGLVNTAGNRMVLEDGADVGVSVGNAGVLQVGQSIGTATVKDLSQTLLATLEMEIDGTVPGAEYDQLFVTGTVDLAAVDGSTLDIPVNENGGSYGDPASPGDYDDFYLITSDTLVDTFAEIIYDGTPLIPSFTSSDLFRSYVGDGLFRIVEYADAGVTLVNYRALGGDANGDFLVDASDFNIWNAHKFGPGAFTEGDFNGDGLVDASDFNIWNANKFTSAGRASLVPEPAAWVLLALAGIAATSWARRQGSEGVRSAK